MIVAHRGGDVTPLGIVLILAAALSWAGGNIVGRANPGVNMLAYVVWASVFAVPPLLVLSFLFEGWSWVVSVRQFSKAKGDLGWWQAFVKSKDPPLFMVVFEDSAALVGIVIAAVGIVLAAHFDLPLADGVSSILIGLVLAGTSTLLLRESKSLLIGERADGELIQSILAIANAACGPSHANGVLTVHLAPDQVMAAMSFEFDDALTAPQIEEMIADIERRIHDAHPEVSSLFIKPQSPQQYTRTVREKFGENVADATRGQTMPVTS